METFHISAQKYNINIKEETKKKDFFGLPLMEVLLGITWEDGEGFNIFLHVVSLYDTREWLWPFRSSCSVSVWTCHRKSRCLLSAHPSVSCLVSGWIWDTLRTENNDVQQQPNLTVSNSSFQWAALHCISDTDWFWIYNISVQDLQGSVFNIAYLFNS